MTRPKKVLVIADNLAGFRSSHPCFDQLGPGWEVEFSQSCQDALFCIRRTAFDLIFVELEAGPLAGADLIYDLRHRQPNAVYFLIGDSLAPDVIVACAKGCHQFLTKPVDAPLLAAALERADLVQGLLLDGDVQKLVASIRIFPSRPEIYLNLMRELRSPMASAQSVGELVEQDLAISTKLLQVVNSAYFGLQQRISTPSEAVLHLGMETTASLVLALEVFAHFDHLHPNYFAIDHVWKHSQAVADSARSIAARHSGGVDLAREAYTAGLLHDIGKLALSINIKEEYGGVLRLARQRGVPVWRAEMDTLGTTHAAVGGYLLALWGMPAGIVSAVAGHHARASALPARFTAGTALHLANTLEYRRAPLLKAFPGFELDVAYPEELGLGTYFNSEAVHPADADSPAILLPA